MADSGSGNTGVVAIFAIVLLVMIAGFVAWQGGWLGGGGGGGNTEINVDLPTPGKKD